MATSEGLVNQLKQDLDRLSAWPKDTLFTMRDYEAEFGVDREDLVGCVGWQHALRGMAMSLAMLQGKTGIIRADPRDNSNSLLTYTQDLPDDLAPMVITDASGRVRQTYLEWKLSNRPVMLEVSPPAPKSYSNLKIHQWNRGRGKRSWARGDTPELEARRQELLSGLEQWLNRKPEEDYLIVHHRPLTGRARGRKGIPSLPKLLRQRGNIQGDFRTPQVHHLGQSHRHEPVPEHPQHRPGRHPLPAGAGLRGDHQGRDGDHPRDGPGEAPADARGHRRRASPQHPPGDFPVRREEVQQGRDVRRSRGPGDRSA